MKTLHIVQDCAPYESRPWRIVETTFHIDGKTSQRLLQVQFRLESEAFHAMRTVKPQDSKP